MDPSYAKSGVGIPAPLLQRVNAEQHDFGEAKEALAQEGKMLFRLVDGSLTAFGPQTSATKEAIDVDIDKSQAPSVLAFYQGPIVKQARSIRESIQAARYRDAVQAARH
jgi:hypothetical protein